VQVHPIKPVLTLPGSILLKLRCDGPLSNFAFNFTLHRYTQGRTVSFRNCLIIMTSNLGSDEIAYGGGKRNRKPEQIKVRRCRLKPFQHHVESAWSQRLKLNCDELVPNFALISTCAASLRRR